MRQYTMNKSTEQTEYHVPGSAYPKEISQQRTPATRTEVVHCQGVLLGLPSLSLTTEGSWIHVGG